MVLGGQREQLLARLVLGHAGRASTSAGITPFGQVVDAGEVVAPAVAGDATAPEEVLERHLAVVPVPPRALLADALGEIAGDAAGRRPRCVDRPRSRIAGRRSLSVKSLVHLCSASLICQRWRWYGPSATCEASCTQYSNSSPSVGGVGDQAARVRPEPGEQRQLLAAHQHVDRVDLDQPDPVEHPAQVAAVDPPRRAGIGEALRGERDAARRRKRRRVSATSAGLSRRR